MEQQPKQKRVSPLTLVLMILIVLLAGAAAVLALGRFSGEEPEEEQGQPAGPTIGYEEGVTVVNDPDALQKAVDKMFEEAEEGGIPLEYQNVATSEDGKKFECYIANPVDDRYDMYIQIFSNLELTDELYLSGLIPPGKAMRELNLAKELAPGTNTVYVAFTQVEDDHATIHNQIVVTMEFVVDK